MIKPFLISLIGLFVGIVVGIFITKSQATVPSHTKESETKQVIGFLPYWQLERANQNELKYITTLTYFGLNVGGDGHIVKMVNDTQDDPGWYGLHSDKLEQILKNAKNMNIKLSLLIASGDTSAINNMVNNPREHAATLVNDVAPIIKRYGFDDLNLDIEDTGVASPGAEKKFTQFVKDVKNQMTIKKLGTLTLEISIADTIKTNLINISAVEPYADTIILMAYDFHSPDSDVTGPVAPLNGAGIDSEYDVTTAIEKSLPSVQPNQFVLGMPLYGYEWETLNTAARSAIIPGSGVLASNNRTESMISQCASCSAFFDDESKEAFIEYHDDSSGTYHQFSVPNEESVDAKLSYAKKEHLGGVALWALGYEGNSILEPLFKYKQ